ncbi:glsA [Lepeophtheirus salmonis]|uniref:glutaminase n=1 Tax=Lepeophtheirus salmonis TaxID=72036 RepID=A0A7R8CH44_LEPSM|nr:glsA [Lepeophtheirus salmonis]CAF2820874.1 glsA [Lepeophtheirus salmonis]
MHIKVKVFSWKQETSNSAIENEEETNIDSQAKSYGDIFINSPSSNFEHIYTSRTSCEGSNLIQSSKEGIFDNGHKIRMASGKNSSKGSCCSTPISSVSRAEIAYPSPNFIRPAIYSVEQESCDENSKLTIKLHYNPVMDEWVSLTENESLIPEEVINYQESIMLFDMHKIEINNGTEEIVNSLMKELDHIKRSNEECGTSIEGLQLDKETFIRVIKNNLTLIIRAFKKPTGYTGIWKVASYIPQLARYDANYWGISICTVDGQRLSVGDTNIPFTLQSCSKPFTYAVCLNELGSEVVHQYVGQEPSGKMFNELSLDKNNKPHNPLLNSGAIMSSAILLNLIHPEMKMSEKFDYKKKCFPKGFELQNCLDFYFQTCSMEVTCETVAVMAASLANGGKCPTTEEDTLNPDSVRDVLSLMHTTTGDLTALKRCYFNDINMSLSNYDNRTALHLSAAEGHLECTEFLVVEKCNLDPLTKDRWGYTPLSEAKRFEHEMVYRYLSSTISFYIQDYCIGNPKRGLKVPSDSMCHLPFFGGEDIKDML